MDKKFRNLRGVLRDAGVDQCGLAAALDITQSGVSMRLSGRQPWKLDEMYAVLDMVKKGPEMLPILFPRDGDDKTLTAPGGICASEGDARGRLISFYDDLGHGVWEPFTA